jgi:hypothetical protein
MNYYLQGLNDSTRRTCRTAVTLGGFLKHLGIPRKQTLPTMTFKKKIKKCSHYSIKEINQIYLSIRCESPAKLPRVQIACSATTG